MLRAQDRHLPVRPEAELGGRPAELHERVGDPPGEPVLRRQVLGLRARHGVSDGDRLVGGHLPQLALAITERPEVEIGDDPQLLRAGSPDRVVAGRGIGPADRLLHLGDGEPGAVDPAGEEDALPVDRDLDAHEGARLQGDGGPHERIGDRVPPHALERQLVLQGPLARPNDFVLTMLRAHLCLLVQPPSTLQQIQKN